MMFQSYALFPHLKVIDNVAFALKISGIGKAERHERAMALIESVILKRWPTAIQISFQVAAATRSSTARALITKPKLLLLDEPLSALDPFLRIEMRAELKALQRQWNHLCACDPQSGRSDGAV